MDIDSKIILFSQVQYDKRDQYTDLVNKCVTDKIGLYSFKFKFFKMFRENQTIFDGIVKKFELSPDIPINFNSKSDEFNTILEDIFSICELSDSPLGPDNIDAISQLEVKTFLEEILSKLKKIF